MSLFSKKKETTDDKFDHEKKERALITKSWV